MKKKKFSTEVKKRFGWEINPKTRVQPSDKVFVRAREKKAINALLKEIRELD